MEKGVRIFVFFLFFKKKKNYAKAGTPAMCDGWSKCSGSPGEPGKGLN